MADKPELPIACPGKKVPSSLMGGIALKCPPPAIFAVPWAGNGYSNDTEENDGPFITLTDGTPPTISWGGHV